MDIDRDTVVNLIRDIANFGLNVETHTEFEIADEVSSVNYFNPLYKISELANHYYEDLHFICNDRVFDVFVFKSEDTNLQKLHQLIICNNYVLIVQFDQNNYDARRTVSEFKNPGKIYSFFDRSIIIIENEKPTNNIKYEYIN